MTVLVVAPHPDDEAIGCGGALLRHVADGDAVHVAFLTSGELGLPTLEPQAAWQVREAEAASAAQVLGVRSHVFLRQPDWYLEQHIDDTVTRLSHLLDSCSPQIVYAPHGADSHPDHRAAHRIAAAAAARCGLERGALFGYEVWTPLPTFSVIKDITEVMPGKLAAIRCYVSQLESFDYLRAAVGLATYRGALAARTSYAEVFDRGDLSAAPADDPSRSAPASGSP